MRGDNLLQCWSQTQPNVCLSSGVAELHGICRGASKGLGLQSLAGDLGLSLQLSVHTDATAAIGICRRRGLGHIRHLAVADLCVQDKVRAGDVSLQKLKGFDNPADCLTKYVDHGTMSKHLHAMGWEYEDGRAESAPQLAPDRPPPTP